MPKKEVPISQLQQFVPDGTYEAVLDYLRQFKVHLTVAKERKSILGDYRHRTNQENHRISVNGNLNQYAFLITLLHELAHLLTFERFGNRVMSHGTEWKSIYGQLLDQFLQHKIFPPDIEKEIMVSLHNPAASSCAEDGLIRILRRYDPPGSPFILVEEVKENSLFRTDDGRIFQKGKKLRKRFQCKEVKSARMYLFSPVYEVERVEAGGGSP
ncbi:MAG: SprT-like domain-containing protein [Chitinophagaceae bacterium]|nr:SprT-like domain-containing protein [Chitinophagaceae bacterium]